MRFSSITTRTMRALAWSAALSAAAGCSANGSQSSSLPGRPLELQRSGQTALNSTANQTATGGVPNSSSITTCPQDRVYVSNYFYGDIEIFPKDWITSPLPCATITHSTLGPSGISVDQYGTLYVSNFCCNAISIFKRNARVPSRMLITTGQPQYAYAGQDGTVYASEPSLNQVEIFAPGATAVTRTISIQNCWGVATDSRNNLYVVSDVGGGHVVKFAPGASTGTDLGLSMGFADGLKIAANDTIVVGQSGGGIQVFAHGATTPTRSFPSIHAFDITLSHFESKLYVASSVYAGGVAEYDFKTGALIGTITAGLLIPDGVAYDPAPLY